MKESSTDRVTFVALVCILAAVTVYALLALKIGAVDKNDLPARLRRKIWKEK